MSLQTRDLYAEEHDNREIICENRKLHRDEEHTQ